MYSANVKCWKCKIKRSQGLISTLPYSLTDIFINYISHVKFLHHKTFRNVSAQLVCGNSSHMNGIDVCRQCPIDVLFRAWTSNISSIQYCSCGSKTLCRTFVFRMFSKLEMFYHLYASLAPLGCTFSNTFGPHVLHGSEIDLAAVRSYAQKVIGASCGGNLRIHVIDAVLMDFKA